MKVTRKIFVCAECGFIYGDEPVSQCDCMPDEQEWIEGVATYNIPFKPLSLMEAIELKNVERTLPAWHPCFEDLRWSKGLSGTYCRQCGCFH